MKSIKLVCALLIGTLALSSCLKDNNFVPEPSGLLVFVNGYTPTQGVSYFLDQNRLLNLQYANTDSRSNIAIGTRELSVTTSNNASIADTEINIEDGHIYSTFLFGTSNNPKLYTTKETFVGLDDLGSQSAIRFIHMANGLEEEVDFYIGDEKINALSNRTQETEESFLESQKFTIVNNGTVDIWIKDKEGNKLDSIKNAQLRNSAVVSLQWVGTHESEDQPLKLLPTVFN